MQYVLRTCLSHVQNQFTHAEVGVQYFTVEVAWLEVPTHGTWYGSMVERRPN
jgi:hypothetical protein